MFKYLLTLVLTLWMAVPSVAQEFNKKVGNKYKAMRLAAYAYEHGMYYAAIDMYLSVLEKSPNDRESAFRLAECYREVRDYNNALKWYQVVYSKDEAGFPESKFYYAQMLKRTGNYKDSKALFDDVAKKYKGNDRRTIKSLAKEEAAGCGMALASADGAGEVKVHRVEGKVNNGYFDYAPLPMGKDTLVFSSLRSDALVVLQKQQVEQVTGLYYTVKNGDAFSDAKPLEGPFNLPDEHTVYHALSSDKQFFYFSRCAYSRKYEKDICAIYVSKREQGGWGEPLRLGDGINYPGYSSSQPAIGLYKEGQEALYFVSDRPGSKGGTDIWIAAIRNGIPGNGRNLGKQINTVGDDGAPFYDRKERKFYFSSTGWPGLGGYDVFETSGLGKKFSPPQNLGSPINSPADDLDYVLLDNSNEGYLASNRKGSLTLKEAYCCEDLYYFKWVNKFDVYVRGMVYKNAMSDRSKLNGAQVALYLAGENGSELLLAKDTIRDGKVYGFNIKPKQSYVLKASKDGHFIATATITTYHITKTDTLVQDFELTEIKKNQGYTIRNINYEFAKADLTPDSREKLDSLVNILKINDRLLIEIGSHTDSKGSDELNMKLSEKRAISVVKYLIGNGIEKDRLKAKGYGETQPIALNENPDGSDNPDGRALNRRTEFKVLGELPPKPDDDDNDEDDEEEDGEE